MDKHEYEAIVIGSGPNGLSAAICFAQQGISTLVVEGGETVGGGARTAELTLPGFRHDICSTIHPLAAGSPFFRTLPLREYGLELIEPPASVAHALDDGTAVLLKRSFFETGEYLGVDRDNYERILHPFVEGWADLAPEILGPVPLLPRHPFLLGEFGWRSLRSTISFVESYFEGPRAKAAFAGCAAHSMIPLEDVPSAACGLVLAILAHTDGWVIPRGGSQSISDALAEIFVSLGGRIELNRRVENVDDLPASKVLMFDLTPRQIVKIAGHRLPDNYRERLESYEYGSAAFKLDYALSEPVPWRAKECLQAGTVHLGGTVEELADSERAHREGRISEKPFVLWVQTSLFDETRAPEGRQTGWAYAHVPNGWDGDATEAIEDQIERFAPGFRDCILERRKMPPAALEDHNPNNVGGDIGGGANTLSQTFTRPVASFHPYTMPTPGYYICSSSTPPGGGVHGMCGFHAAKAALADHFGRDIELTQKPENG
jgi:phytoene dehydrogenase-like protein